MMLDQPGDQLGLGGCKADPRAEPPRDAGARDRMVLDAALGDVVEEQRHVQHDAMARLNGAHQLVGERIFGIVAALDLGEDAEAAQQVLVHRVVMIHVELHHRDDAAEIRHEAPEHAGLVHAPQHDLDVVLAGQHGEEQPVGLLVLTQVLVDQLERSRRGAHGVGMKDQAVALREIEHPDQVDRIALEHLRVGDRDAVVVDDEVLGLAQGAPAARAKLGDHAVEHRHRLGFAILQPGAQDRGEIAHVFGDQEVVLHEALDVLLPGMLGVAEPQRDLALQVEGDPLLGAAGDEVQVAAHRPEEILAAAEQPVFPLIEHAALDQLVGRVHQVDVLGDPEQRVQVAQAALAVLHVGLDQVARLPDPAVALLALGQLGGDEGGRGPLRHLLVEAGDQLFEQLGVAEQIARFQHRGADRHVGLGLADALVHRTGGVPDLQPHVPQTIENGLGNQLAPGGLLVGQEEQQIDVRAGRQQAAPVAAGRHHRHALGLGRIVGGIEMLGRELVEHADDLVLHRAQPLGATPAVPIRQQQPLGGGAPLIECRLEPLRDRGTSARARGRHWHRQGRRGRLRATRHRTRRHRAARGRCAAAWHRDNRARAFCHRRVRSDAQPPRARQNVCEHRIRGISFSVARQIAISFQLTCAITDLYRINLAPI